jgi:hypothetical protein
MSDAARVAIVAHDAGGAQIVSSYVRRPGAALRERCVFALAGPASAIFESKLGAFTSVSPREAVAAAGSVLCGTGWQTDWELSAIREARGAGKKSAAFLDHWVNYRERFTRGAAVTLPDQVWVTDELALDIARRELPEVPARLAGNPYLLDVRDQLAAQPPRPASAGLRVLYVCEPMREHALRQFGDERHWGYTEEEAMTWFLDHVHALGGAVEAIVVRPHPSEPAGKYDEVLRGYHLPLRVSSEPELLADIAAADVVAGCNSMAMVIALEARRRVICCIPPGGRPCVLPHGGIEQLARRQGPMHGGGN